MGQVTLSNSTNYDENKNAVGTTVRADLDAIVNEINGNVDASNIQAGAVDTSELAADAVTNAKIADNAIYEANVYWGEASAGVLAARTGPNFAGSAAPRLVRVSKAFTSTGGASEDITVTFATDCADGDPAFAVAPIVMGKPEFRRDTTTAADMVDYTYIKTKTTTTMVVHVAYLGGGAAAAVAMTMEVGLLGALSA